MTRRLVDRTGMKFGRLTALEHVGAGVWLCECECGKRTRVLGGNLGRGNSKSCGCLFKERITKHGLCGKRIHIIWKYMMSRCYDPAALGYENYGGRGIKVCERWHKVENFHADMGDPPEGLTLDRIKNDKGYEKSNCKWSNWSEQHRNRRNNNLVTAFGKTQTMIEWAEEYKINGRTLHNRIMRSKMHPEIALTTPLFDTLRVKRGPNKR